MDKNNLSNINFEKIFNEKINSCEIYKLFEKVSVLKPIYKPKPINAKSAINLAEVKTS